MYYYPLKINTGLETCNSIIKIKVPLFIISNYKNEQKTWKCLQGGSKYPDGAYLQVC